MTGVAMMEHGRRRSHQEHRDWLRSVDRSCDDDDACLFFDFFDRDHRHEGL